MIEYLYLTHTFEDTSGPTQKKNLTGAQTVTISFSRSDDVTSHRSSVHGFRETHECWVCGKFLSSYSKLELHICLHTGERPHSCPMCMKGYLSLKGLKKHIRSHKNGTKLIEIGNI